MIQNHKKVSHSWCIFSNVYSTSISFMFIFLWDTKKMTTAKYKKKYIYVGIPCTLWIVQTLTHDAPSHFRLIHFELCWVESFFSDFPNVDFAECINYANIVHINFGIANAIIVKFPILWNDTVSHSYITYIHSRIDRRYDGTPTTKAFDIKKWCAVKQNPQKWANFLVEYVQSYKNSQSFFYILGQCSHSPVPE